ncbi:DUF1080 domain-containing protein [Niabella defluvii]|nr:DUF1080 domain-containing protein [Niabella sp. I65]
MVLFNGKDLDEWQTEDGKPARWKVEQGIVTVTKGTGVIKTKKAFGDCQLHVEWRTPAEVKGEGQGRGNSGIFLMGLYELQVLDSYNNRTYSKRSGRQHLQANSSFSQCFKKTRRMADLRYYFYSSPV